MKISSLNANGLADSTKRQKAIKLLEEGGYDIVFLQETHFNKCPEWEGKAFHAFGTTRSAGVSILFSRFFQFEPILLHCSPDGRICVVESKVNNQMVRFINVYAPNNPQDRIYFFNERVEQLLATDNTIVMAGDFNCIDSVSKDSYRHSDATTSLIGSEELLSLADQAGLCDTYRMEHPHGTAMTWYGHGGAQASRIDRFFCSRTLKTNTSVEVFPYSDHSMVKCIITDGPRDVIEGKSYWKLNTSALVDKK